jgi:hypothetical protein
MNTVDEVDFLDQKSGCAAFMHLRETEIGSMSIGFDVVGGDAKIVAQLEVTVSLSDARRLGERLLSGVDDIASEL